MSDPTATPSLSSQLKALPLEIAGPILHNFFANLEANPGSVANLAGQFASLSVSLTAALPNAESGLVKDISTAADAAIQKALAKA